ncbi:hypothetical protein [Rhizobacter sp. SG703]|uniref:hypothetical protein n=1 Tax=Rhizobacter sp. SG703 TaxID=2587140 RepID=UPI0014486161|nr:hypothetical protein [Rhizobacter sp. SG703]NKI96634.1 hypothetical protein [Rhizobacter sp. SG703]
MPQFTTNIQPGGHPPPADRRTTASPTAERNAAPTAEEFECMEIAGRLKLSLNSWLSVEDLAGLGLTRLKELQQKNAAGTQTPAPANRYASYDLNAINSGEPDEGELLRLISEVVSLVRGAGTEAMKGLGEATLKDLKKRLTTASNSNGNYLGYDLNNPSGL